ncbi:phage portal protein [Rhodococcus rhodnii]|uniref:Phage portal protein n=3 Tax=Rhodococcus rhodnii TaxID=38312 RepID=R7WT22_9NOCA|nr:phage portal protein [Rhodococcus rhodnii]EOM77289.1 hypothetical protein Rrhod_1351 [Rhodococcus rhodnii LMG 5362]TXG89059.1 phage portal protein [Rhodococcus rhodnii]
MHASIPIRGQAGTTAAVIDMPTDVAGFDHDEQNLFDELLRQYFAKLPRNRIRQQYFDAKNAFKDLGIAIPPDLVNIGTVLGWPAKAVDGLARRNKMDGFVIPGTTSEDIGIDEIWDANNMEIEVPQVHTSAYTHSCAFVTVVEGDTQSGEPDVVISPRSALDGTGLWDTRRRQLKAFLAIVDVDDAGRPSLLLMYTPDRVIHIERYTLGWRIERRRHRLGRVPVEVLVHGPHLKRPFGTSRISRPVMSITDSALRTAVRMEVHAEFFSSPQRWAMGADESAFVDPATGELKSQWQAIMGRIWAIGRDDQGNVPQVGTFASSSPQPHSDQLRTYATMFSGETSIPVGSLGVVQDNPSSAEAIHAAKEDLLIEADYCNRVFGVGWRRIATTALQLAERRTEPRPEWRKLRAKWRNPATMSQQSMAIAGRQYVETFPWLAETEVGLELAGLDETMVARAMAEQRRTRATSTTRERLRELAAERAADPTVQDLADQREPAADVPEALQDR